MRDILSKISHNNSRFIRFQLHHTWRSLQLENGNGIFKTHFLTRWKLMKRTQWLNNWSGRHREGAKDLRSYHNIWLEFASKIVDYLRKLGKQWLGIFWLDKQKHKFSRLIQYQDPISPLASIFHIMLGSYKPVIRLCFLFLSTSQGECYYRLALIVFSLSLVDLPIAHSTN